MADERAFLGTGWAFPPSFDKATGVGMVSDVEDIRQSLIILLSTEKGDNFLNPDYGCELRKFVFEDVTTSFETELKAAIFDAITTFEPRIVLEDVDLLLDEINDGVVYVSLDYMIRSMNVNENLVYPFYMATTTNSNEQ